MTKTEVAKALSNGNETEFKKYMRMKKDFLQGVFQFKKDTANITEEQLAKVREYFEGR